ncbi:MAG: hypothetical protein AB1633_03375, partial [Elusimicrobiota bacterium]
MSDNENNYSELKRKLMHLGTVLYPVLYNILPRTTAYIISGGLIIIDILVESLRLTFPGVNKVVLRLMSGFYREGERNGISALLWTFTGAFFTMYIFEDEKIVTTALLYMVFGDSIAGFIGVRHGRTKIGAKKSLEGSLSCFVVCLICGLFFIPWQ